MNHTSFFREPAHFTFMAERIAAWLKESPGMTDPDLVGGVFVGPGALQHGDGAGRDDQRNFSSQKVEIWASDLSLEMLKLAAGAIYTTRDVQGVAHRRGSGGSFCWAGDRARARFASCPRFATW